MAYENPIVEAVGKQCPDIADEQRNPYAKRLTGDEILNIICEKNCTRIQDVKHPGMKNKDTIIKQN